MSGNKQDAGFGRDDMAALLGGGLPERLMRPQVPVAKSSNKASRKDVSDMSTQETAAWLLQQQQQQQQKKGKQSSTTQRHRTTKVRKYHELLLEEQQNLSIATTKPSKENSKHAESDSDGEENNVQAVPAPVVTRRRRRPSTSSSSSDSSSAPRRRPRQDSNSSDSDDDLEEESRRRRLLERRKLQQQQSSSPVNEIDERAEEPITAPPSRTVAPVQQKVTDSNQRQNESSSSSSSSSSESSTEESSSEDEVEEVRAKPIFVPRHKRGVIQSADHLAEQEEAIETKRKQREERRMKESRAMVQQVLLDASKQVGSNEDAFEGITGARNAVPDDEDLDNDQEIDEWEVRELERLVGELDMENARVDEAKERERRRNMTDEEIMKEKMDSGSRDKRREDESKRGGQRYFHRGAFYMDESEWDESDVRHKADEYAAAATGEDKIDKKALPKVMQVKNFGRANQNLKYQGLAAEDTTDKQIKILPILGPKRKQNQL